MNCVCLNLFWGGLLDVWKGLAGYGKMKNSENLKFTMVKNTHHHWIFHSSMIRKNHEIWKIYHRYVNGIHVFIDIHFMFIILLSTEPTHSGIGIWMNLFSCIPSMDCFFTVTPNTNWQQQTENRIINRIEIAFYSTVYSFGIEVSISSCSSQCFFW